MAKTATLQSETEAHKLMQQYKSYTQRRRKNMLYFCFPKRSILTVEGKQMFICFG